MEVLTPLDKPLPGTPQSITFYTRDDVKKHCDVTSCWVIFRNRVYDVTGFLEQHPGGYDILLENAGMDITGTFVDKGHSRFAHTLLQQYYIGDLIQSDRLQAK